MENIPLSREEKICFIRHVQSLYWTMTSRDVLKSFDDDKLDRIFQLMVDNCPPVLLEKSIETARREAACQD